MRVQLLIKSVCYRLYSIGIALVFFWFLFGEIVAATQYTIILELIKVLQYFCFELFWQRFSRSTNMVQ